MVSSQTIGFYKTPFENLLKKMKSLKV